MNENTVSTAKFLARILGNIGSELSVVVWLDCYIAVPVYLQTPRVFAISMCCFVAAFSPNSPPKAQAFGSSRVAF
jgi:hypothetical protein